MEIALIGIGKIAIDQHVPAIQNSSACLRFHGLTMRLRQSARVGT